MMKNYPEESKIAMRTEYLRLILFWVRFMVVGLCIWATVEGLLLLSDKL